MDLIIYQAYSLWKYCTVPCRLAPRLSTYLLFSFHDSDLYFLRLPKILQRAYCVFKFPLTILVDNSFHEWTAGSHIIVYSFIPVHVLSDFMLFGLHDRCLCINPFMHRVALEKYLQDLNYYYKNSQNI